MNAKWKFIGGIGISATLLFAGTGTVAFARVNRAAQAHPKLGFVMAFSLVSRWVQDRAGFIEEAHKLGDPVTVVSSQASAQTQANQVQDMIARGINGLAIAPVDLGTASTLFSEAQRSGVKVVDYNFVATNSNPAYIVGRNAYYFGELQARYALKARPRGNYVLIGGDPGTSIAQDNMAGYYRVLKPAIKAGRIKIVSAKFNLGWSPSSAQTQMEEALVKTHNHVAAVLSNNDGMLLGAVQALKAQHLLGKVFTSGVDGDLTNVQYIAKGQETVDVWNDFREMGEIGALAANDAALGRKLTEKQLAALAPKGTPVPRITTMRNGKWVVPIVYMPTYVITRRNVCSWVKQYHWYTAKQVFGTSSKC